MSKCKNDKQLRTPGDEGVLLHLAHTQCAVALRPLQRLVRARVQTACCRRLRHHLVLHLVLHAQVVARHERERARQRRARARVHHAPPAARQLAARLQRGAQLAQRHGIEGRAVHEGALRQRQLAAYHLHEVAHSHARREGVGVDDQVGLQPRATLEGQLPGVHRPPNHALLPVPAAQLVPHARLPVLHRAHLQASIGEDKPLPGPQYRRFLKMHSRGGQALTILPKGDSRKMNLIRTSSALRRGLGRACPPHYDRARTVARCGRASVCASHTTTLSTRAGVRSACRCTPDLSSCSSAAPDGASVSSAAVPSCSVGSVIRDQSI